MSKGKRARRDRKAARKVRRSRSAARGAAPDEFFQVGPLRASRFGTLNLFENAATPEQQLAINRALGSRFDEIRTNIRLHVNRCCEIVREVDSIQLLTRCYWHWFHESLEARPEESRQTAERNEASQLLEYAQKLVLGVGDRAISRPATDDQFLDLTRICNSVFKPLQVDYFLCRSGRLSERVDYDRDLDEYAVRTEMNWLSVRGHRYLSHEAPYFTKMLGPQSMLVESVYGVTSTQIANGIEAILSSLSKGMFRVFKELDEFRSDTLDAIKANPVLAHLPPQQAMASVLETNGWIARKDSIFGRMFGTDLFDVGLITGWPPLFMDDLAIAPGEDTAFADSTDEACWPTKLSAMQTAPFVKRGDQFFCFNIRGLTDRLYRAIEKGVQRRLNTSERWNKNQKTASESITADLFSRLLPGAQVFMNAHYWVADPTGTQVLTDCDLVVIFDRSMFVVEVKAGRYTHKPPGSNIRDHIKSLKQLIETAAAQANRFIGELTRNGKIAILDAKAKERASICASEIESIFRCCITLDQIDDITSHAEDLAKLGIDIGPDPVWTVSVNDLLVYADVFQNPLVFIDYLKERLRAFSSPFCHVSDELDHVGLYLAQNRYVMRAEKLAPAEMMGFAGFRDGFDKYYDAMWKGERGILPAQRMPPWMEQVLTLLAQSRAAGRTFAAGKLMELDGETRDALGSYLESMQKLQWRQGRPRPFSSAGTVRLTVAVSQKGSFQWTVDDAKEYALSVLALHEERDRLLVWLQYSEFGTLENIKWAHLTPEDTINLDGAELKRRVERLRASREKKRSKSSHNV